jgi:hypothetical protein
MNCPACSNTFPDGSTFCEFCGVDLRPARVTTPVVVGRSTAVAPAVAKASLAHLSSEPTAAALAEIGGALIKKLSLGEKLSGAGALASTVGFFLPWFSGANLQSFGDFFGGLRGVAAATYSGLDAARLWGAFYLILAAAVASGVLFYSAAKTEYSRKLLISAFQIMIGSLYGPAIVFAILFVPFMQSLAGLGLWLTGLGFCSIAAGGFVTISQLGRTAR